MGEKSGLEQKTNAGQSSANERSQQNPNERRSAGMGAGAGKGWNRDQGDEKNHGPAHAQQGLFFRMIRDESFHPGRAHAHDDQPGRGVADCGGPGDHAFRNVNGYPFSWRAVI
jgi:hypothetical protein